MEHDNLISLAPLIITMRELASKLNEAINSNEKDRAIALKRELLILQKHVDQLL